MEESKMTEKTTITERYSSDENLIGESILGKRSKVVCGKVSQKLYDEVKKVIDGTRYKTMNDVVEAAIWHYIMMLNKEGTEGGTSLGN